MFQALSYVPLKNKSVRCRVCQKYCVVKNNQVGDCLTKLNQNGILYSLNYGVIQELRSEPVEKNLFYHFSPGSIFATVGSYGCNFFCKQCLNAWCTYNPPSSTTLQQLAKGGKVSLTNPKDLINEVLEKKLTGIVFGINEPVVWSEYLYETLFLAKKARLKTAIATNGSWSKETLEKIGPYLDAANIDLKGFYEKTYKDQGGFFKKIPQMIIKAKNKYKIFLEMTTLLIPGVNDNPREISLMTKWMVKHLGPNIPWHLSQYDPHLSPNAEYKKIPHPSLDDLSSAANIGKKNGLHFVYVWANASNYGLCDTHCPECSNLAIKRIAFQVEKTGIDDKGRCIKCGRDLNLVLI